MLLCPLSCGLQVAQSLAEGTCQPWDSNEKNLLASSSSPGLLGEKSLHKKGHTLPDKRKWMP